jgi:hypothetical protein
MSSPFKLCEGPNLHLCFKPSHSRACPVLQSPPLRALLNTPCWTLKIYLCPGGGRIFPLIESWARYLGDFREGGGKSRVKKGFPIRLQKWAWPEVLCEHSWQRQGPLGGEENKVYLQKSQSKSLSMWAHAPCNNMTRFHVLYEYSSNPCHNISQPETIFFCCCFWFLRQGVAV